MIHNINHPNELTRKKVNFFADLFSYVNNKIGLYGLISIETPLSIVENIKFQLENNIELCSPYFDIYINNELISNYNFRTGSKLIDDFNSFILAYKTLEDKRKNGNG